MRAIVMKEFGDEDVLEVAELPEPEAGPSEVLVKVEAVEVSRTRDVAMRSGRHPFSRQVTLPHVPGGDFAGIVEAVGPGVDPGLVGHPVAVACMVRCGRCEGCQAGDGEACRSPQILGIHRQGSYAERVVVPAYSVRRVSADVPMVEVAAMAATGPLALAQLATAGVVGGSTLLVVGAGGSVGTMLSALAAARGAKAIALSRHPEGLPPGLATAGALAADSAELAAELRTLTDGAGVEAVIDNVGVGEVFGRYFGGLARGGRVVLSGAVMAGQPAAILPVPAAQLYLGGISILGLLGPGPDDHLAFWAEVESGFRLPEGLIEELPMPDARIAHRAITAGGRIGHTVLTGRW